MDVTFQPTIRREYTSCTKAIPDHVAFIVDVYAQRIIAWHAATSKEVELVMRSRRMATWGRDTTGIPFTAPT